MRRPSIDATLMDIAQVWSSRSTCERRHVGAVIAKNGRHIGSGYNGAPAGLPHCIHDYDKAQLIPARVFGLTAQRPLNILPIGCKVAIHAEANAVAYCARDGISTAGATLYVTLSPCYSCAQLIVASGFARVVYGEAYRDPAGIHLLDSSSITVEKWLGLS